MKLNVWLVLVEHFKRVSLLIAIALQKRQQQMIPDKDFGSPLQIVQDVRTEWNSVFYMIDRLLKLQWPICAVTSR